jgi:hypothetical protein
MVEHYKGREKTQQEGSNTWTEKELKLTNIIH